MMLVELIINFDDLAPEWDMMNDTDKVSRLSHIFSNRIPFLAAPVLDAGSGTGILLPILQKLYGHFVFEMDIARRMLHVARNKFFHFNNSPVNYSFFVINI